MKLVYQGDWQSTAMVLEMSSSEWREWERNLHGLSGREIFSRNGGNSVQHFVLVRGAKFIIQELSKEAEKIRGKETAAVG